MQVGYKNGAVGRLRVYLLVDEVWIPPDATDLKSRLMIVAHAVTAGYQGEAYTRIALSGEFTWDQKYQDDSAFVATWLLCILAKPVTRSQDHWHQQQPGKNQMQWYVLIIYILVKAIATIITYWS